MFGLGTRLDILIIIIWIKLLPRQSDNYIIRHQNIITTIRFWLNFLKFCKNLKKQSLKFSVLQKSGVLRYPISGDNNWNLHFFIIRWEEISILLNEPKSPRAIKSFRWSYWFFYHEAKSLEEILILLSWSPHPSQTAIFLMLGLGTRLNIWLYG